MIKRIFVQNKAPLFKRAKNILYLKEFNFKQILFILHDLEIKTFEQKIKFYMIFGGIINYYALIDFYNIKKLNDVFDILLLRNPDYVYKQEGRYQDEAGAVFVDKAIKKVIDKQCSGIMHLLSDDNVCEKILNFVRKHEKK